MSRAQKAGSRGTLSSIWDICACCAHDMESKFVLLDLYGRSHTCCDGVRYQDDEPATATVHELQGDDDCKLRRSNPATPLLVIMKASIPPGKAMKKLCKRHGIRLETRLETTIPYMPEHNGVCERLNQTIVKKSRSILDSDVLKKLWVEAV